MSKPETIHIERHMTEEELNRRIKTEEKDTWVLKRLLFVHHRYEGKSVKEAAELAGTTKCTGYIWQKRWNEDGYEGLKPRFVGGGSPKLTEEQKDGLAKTLGTGSYTLKEVHDIILERYHVDYSMKQVRVIVKKMGMKCAKPYQHDHRRPADAEKKLKKTPPSGRLRRRPHGRSVTADRIQHREVMVLRTS